MKESKRIKKRIELLNKILSTPSGLKKIAEILCKNMPPILGEIKKDKL